MPGVLEDLLTLVYYLVILSYNVLNSKIKLKITGLNLICIDIIYETYSQIKISDYLNLRNFSRMLDIYLKYISEISLGLLDQ